MTADVRSAGEHDILAPQLAQLRHAKAGLEQEDEQGSITPAEPGAWIRGREERILLVVRERDDELALGLLRRNREHTLARATVSGLLPRGEAEERVDGGE